MRALISVPRITMVVRDLRRFLAEDLGRRGDITSEAIVQRLRARARIVADEPCVVAGLIEACGVFRLGGAIARQLVPEGHRIERGTRVLEARGTAVKLLACERLALNFLMRMSGIATLTRAVVERARRANPRVEVAATRKTTPGFRRFEKRAVELGGGVAHRSGLHDAVLIKDNHSDLAGSVGEAIRRVRRRHPHREIEAEARDLSEALEAARAGARWILLDNMSSTRGARVARTLRASFPGVRIEASGGIDLSNVRSYARFADRVSLGLLTHSAPARGFSMDVEGT